MKSNLLLASILIVAGIVFQGCTTSNQASYTNIPIHNIPAGQIPAGQIPAGQLNGSITIAKKIPEMSPIEELPIYGFIPFQLSIHSHLKERPLWLEIDTASSVMNAKRGPEVIATLELLNNNFSNRQNKIYTVQHKAENPLWYATDEYYTKRGLNIPAEGDAARFLKGALGNYAIFLDDNLTISSGSGYQLEEVNHLQVSERALADLFDQVELDTKIVVK
jgi:hypothetical protein